MNFKFCFSFFVLCTISWQFSSAMNEKKAIRNCVFKRKIKQDILHQQLPQNVTFNQILANNNLMKPNIQAMLNTTINVVHWYKLSLKQNIQNEKELKKETEIYKSKTNAQCSEVDTDNGTSGDLNKTICLQDRWVTDETLINFFCASSSSSKNSKQKNTIFSPDFLEWGCDDDEKDTSKSFYYITLPDGQTGNKTLYFSKDNNLFTKIITAF